MLPPLKSQIMSARDVSFVAHQTLVQLDFAKLTQFERVNEQYRNLGLSIEDAIALQPSNPAFACAADSLVLMPTASKPHITVSFHQMVQRIRAVVSGARQIRLTVFDRHSNVLLQQHTDQAHSHHPDAGAIELFPQHSLEAAAAGIARVVVASDAPFLLNQLFCG
jgi:hypothetical protein